MSYMTISSQENHHFSLCSYFHAHPTTLLLKILGGPMHGPSPTSNFWGDRPPSPPRSPPLGISRTVGGRGGCCRWHETACRRCWELIASMHLDLHLKIDDSLTSVNFHTVTCWDKGRGSRSSSSLVTWPSQHWNFAPFIARMGV